MGLILSDTDQQCLKGKHGKALQIAMQLITRIAKATNSSQLINIEQAHIVGSYYSGPGDQAFIQMLASEQVKVAVPTTLSSSSADFQQPALYPRKHPETQRACQLIKLYQNMGCKAELTCAPYHLPTEPRRGQAIAWAESNAVVYANSVIGARTNKTYQYLDICAALTGRIPATGMYLSENRRAKIRYQLDNIPRHWLEEDSFYQLLGLAIGDDARSSIPMIVGLPDSVNYDNLRNLGAAAACSGNAPMFHAVGITPEAPTEDDALQGYRPLRQVRISPQTIIDTKQSVNTGPQDNMLAAVCFGAPHFSYDEFTKLISLLNGRAIAPSLKLYIATSRYTLRRLQQQNLLAHLSHDNLHIVADTCTYYGQLLNQQAGTIMTSSLKWAYYGPGNLSANVIFARMHDCIESAIAGKVIIDDDFWKP